MKEIQYSYYPKPYNVLYKETVFEMPFHMHNELELVLCISGAKSVIAGKRIYSAKEKSLFFFPSNCTHRINTDSDEIYKRYVMTISFTWLKNILGRDDRLHIGSFAPHVINLSELEFVRLKALFESYVEYESDKLKGLSILFDILQECERLISVEHDIKVLPLTDIMLYINENIGRELRVSEIAKKFFFNPDYLCRLFKQHTHITITEYINIQRISLARELIDSGKNIQTAQNESGFNNYSHFSRIFKRYMNLTPKQYKNRKYYFDTVN